MIAACTMLIMMTLGVNPPPPDLGCLVDDLFAEFNKPNTPGASVAIFGCGTDFPVGPDRLENRSHSPDECRIVLAKGYGLANLANHTPADAHTNYRIASVTKQFTAMCIMILKERGKLAYDDPIAKFFPGFPTIGKTITIRHLLNHTSGLKDYEDLIPPGQTEQLKDRDVLALLQRETETYFPPGMQYRYSNSGYALLALIVERVSGQDFATFLKQNIFAPLGMKDTVAYERGVSTVPHRALGYRQQDVGWVDADQSLTSAVLGDGGIYTSVLDYFRWDQALYAMTQSEPRAQARGPNAADPPTDPPHLVRPATLAEAFTSGRLADGSATGYGFGWRVETVDGLTRIHHNGETCGFNTAVRRIPERHLTVVVFTNRAGERAAKLADRVLDRLIAEPALMTPPQASE